MYAFVLKGKFLIDGIEADTRDGIGLSEIDVIDFKALSNDAEILLMEVPMQLG